jgi:endoglucanase
VEAAGFEASRGVDGSGTTRWSSAFGDPQWLRVDLGSTVAISRVVLRWEAAFARAYQIQVSNDDANWTNVFATNTGDGGVDDLAVSGSARYVRMNGTQRGTAWGYSLWELEVYGAGGPTPTATTRPTSTPRATATATNTATRTARPTATATSTSTPTASPTGGSPVARNGQLRVCGNRLCNQSGAEIQLRGMSTHGIQWFGQCANTGSVDALANDWKADVLRIAMYVQEGGYETDPAGFKVKIDTLVDMAVARGMYVLIDWHMLTPGDPNFNTARATEFFTYMAQKHGSKPNVLYEIANEPNGVGWTAIRNYAQQIIPVIRQYDPDGVVLVGTRGWSSLGVSEGGSPQEIVDAPVSATNIMYVFHMYAASHGQQYRDALSWAADRLPMFVTEWATQQASGDGPNDFVSGQAYVDLMTQKKISWIGWNYSDDFRTGAVWTVGTCPDGPWNTTRLTEAGTWMRDRIVNR